MTVQTVKKTRPKKSAAQKHLEEYSKMLKVLRKGLGTISVEDQVRLTSVKPGSEITHKTFQKTKAQLLAVIRYLDNRSKIPGRPPKLKRIFDEADVEPAVFDTAVTALFRTQRMNDLFRKKDGTLDMQEFHKMKQFQAELGLT